MITIISYLSGEVKFKISGTRKEAVINKLRINIPVKKIRHTSDGDITFCTYIKHKTLVREESTRYGCNITTIHEKGLPLFIGKYSRRYGLILGAAVALTLVFLSTLLIWEIRITGNSYVSNSDILKTLEKCGVAEGMLINKEALEKVYNSFLMADDRISRISVNFDGTVAKVEVSERKLVPEKLDRNRNTNIVAACDGVIKRIDVFDGSPVVSPGETVTKGQLLISAFSETRSSGIIMRAARGNAWAATLHKYDILVNKKRNIKHIVSKDDTLDFMILGLKSPLKISMKNKKEKHNMESQCYRGELIKGIRLPIVYYLYKRCYYRQDFLLLNKDEASEVAAAELEEIISSQDTFFEIVEKNVTVSESETHFTFTYELTCIENISREQEFIFE